MSRCVPDTSPHYRAKAARRPVLFWWQSALFLAVAVVLWHQIPPAAVFYAPRTLHPLPEPQAAYVTLDPAEAVNAFRGAIMTWTLGGTRQRNGTDVAFEPTDLTDPLPPPELLEQEPFYPGVWRPLPVTPLPVQQPAIARPSATAGSQRPVLPAMPTGVRITPDAALQAAAFTLPEPLPRLPESTGRCRFYLETGENGTPLHVLLLSHPRTPARALLERTLLRANTAGAARGFLDIHWNLTE